MNFLVERTKRQKSYVVSDTITLTRHYQTKARKIPNNNEAQTLNCKVLAFDKPGYPAEG